MQELRDIWRQAAEQLRSQMTEDSYQRWIACITPVRLEEKKLVLGVPLAMFRDWLESNYRDVIEEALRSACGLKLKVVFESGYEPEDMALDAKPAVSEKKEASASAASQPVSKVADKPVAESSITVWDRRFTFDSFVTGENSKFAFGACRTVSENPGNRLNPLFIYSSTGLGKTHLLQGIAQEVMAKNPNAKVMYVNSEDFCNQYIDGMFKHSLPEFRRNVRNLDVLLLDDVQFIGDKQGFQEEFFHTFNALYNAHKQIVMASDRPPHEIGGLEKRLVSRFEWGLTTEILPPDFETRVAIIHKKQEEQECKLGEDVVRFVAKNIKSNVRRLESAVLKCVSWASLTGAKIDVVTAEKLLSGMLMEESDGIVSVENIQRIVAEHYDIRFADMTSKRRPANIAWPRQVAMFMARKMTECSLPAIAEKFNRNHATICHAITSVEEKIQKNDEFRREVDLLEYKIKSL